MCKTNKLILHTRHCFKELVTVKVAMELIMMVKRTQLCRTWNGRVDQEDEHVALSNNLNFKRVVGCQVFWPLKLWFLVWQVLKTMTTKTVGYGKFVRPDNCDIDLVERLRVVKDTPQTANKRCSRFGELDWAQEAEIQSSKQRILYMYVKCHQNMKVLFSVNWKTSKQKFKLVFLVLSQQ